MDSCSRNLATPAVLHGAAERLAGGLVVTAADQLELAHTAPCLHTLLKPYLSRGSLPENVRSALATLLQVSAVNHDATHLQTISVEYVLLHHSHIRLLISGGQAVLGAGHSANGGQAHSANSSAGGSVGSSRSRSGGAGGCGSRRQGCSRR